MWKSRAASCTKSYWLLHEAAPNQIKKGKVDRLCLYPLQQLCETAQMSFFPSWMKIYERNCVQLLPSWELSQFFVFLIFANTAKPQIPFLSQEETRHSLFVNWEKTNLDSSGWKMVHELLPNPKFCRRPGPRFDLILFHLNKGRCFSSKGFGMRKTFGTNILQSLSSCRQHLKNSSSFRWQWS